MSSLAVHIALYFLLFLFAGWANRRQQAVIAYLLEENRVLRDQLGGRWQAPPTNQVNHNTLGAWSATARQQSSKQ